VGRTSSIPSRADDLSARARLFHLLAYRTEDDVTTLRPTAFLANVLEPGSPGAFAGRLCGALSDAGPGLGETLAVGGVVPRPILG